MSKIKEELKYSQSHEWVMMMGADTCRIGITDYAQQSLGDIVYVDMHPVGERVEAQDTLADVESVKAVSEIYSPLSGTISQINEELIDAQMDAEGRVSMLRANTMRMNELASQTALLAERELGSAENQVVEIPLGAALGVSFLSGFGPRLEVQILPVGAVHTSFDTEFETAGINQTRHKIFLNLRATVSLIVPTGSQLVEVTSTVPIAESIIVGEVPESFVDVNNEEDMLNLIP